MGNAIRGLLLCVAFALSDYARAQDEPSGERVRAHVEFLASDLLEGRAPGTRGFDLAATYVATQFRSAGLHPVPEKDWFQTVPLVERRPNVAGPPALRFGTFDASSAAVAVISGEGRQAWDGEAVFVGYGLSGPADGIDDYAGLDVRGKVVVYYDAVPQGLSPGLTRRLTASRTEVAHARGAAGMIALLSAEARKAHDLATYRADFSMPFFNWLDSEDQPFRPIPMRFSVLLWPDAAQHLFANAPLSFEKIEAAGEKGLPLPSFALTGRVRIESVNQWRRYSSPNVIGWLEGSNPRLSKEIVLVTAHLDHLGVDPTVEGTDKTFNGARDNASGVAAMLEIARDIAQRSKRPARPIMFAAVTAEEVGLLGSDYLAEHVPVDGARVVAVVNIDGGIPLNATNKVRAIAGWHSTIGDLVDRIAAREGFGSERDDFPNDQFFERTDHFSFAKRGIPATFLVPGNDDDETTKKVYRDHNHQPSDDLRLPFDWAAGARFARHSAAIVGALADAAEPPRWYSDSYFARDRAPDAPKVDRPAARKSESMCEPMSEGTC